MTRTVDTLVEYFVGEYAPASQVHRITNTSGSEEDTSRAALRNLLTVRPPAPIPPEIKTALDSLLEDEAAQRGSVNANDLPVLANTHGVHSRIGKQVALWEGDLTILEADAVVNAANDQMLGCFVPGHRCIDNVLGAAAGPDLRAECADYMARRQGRPEPTGSAVLTGGYHLPARHVIHTVGPIIPDRNPSDEDEVTLASCYRGILDLTRDSGLDSVGLCSVSTGVFGYPKDQAADVVLDTIDDWLRDNPEEALRIVISAFTEVDVAAYTDALHRRGAL